MTEFLSAFVSELLRKCYKVALKEKKWLMCSISLKLDAVQFMMASELDVLGEAKNKEKKKKKNQSKGEIVRNMNRCNEKNKKTQ